MEIEQCVEYGHEESKSAGNHQIDDAVVPNPSTIAKREIVSTQKKQSFDKADSWQSDRYKEMVSINLFDQKLRRPSSFRFQDCGSNDENFNFSVSCKSSSSDDKVESEGKGLVPSITYLFSSFGSSDLKVDSDDADWLDLYPVSTDVVDEVNPEKPLVQKKRKNPYTKNAEEVCKIFNISSASVFDGGMYVCMYVCMYVYTNVFIYFCVYT